VWQRVANTQQTVAMLVSIRRDVIVHEDFHDIIMHALVVSNQQVRRLNSVVTILVYDPESCRL
jgi:hypothetical protein